MIYKQEHRFIWFLLTHILCIQEQQSSEVSFQITNIWRQHS